MNLELLDHFGLLEQGSPAAIQARLADFLSPLARFTRVARATGTAGAILVTEVLGALFHLLGLLLEALRLLFRRAPVAPAISGRRFSARGLLAQLVRALAQAGCALLESFLALGELGRSVLVRGFPRLRPRGFLGGSASRWVVGSGRRG